MSITLGSNIAGVYVGNSKIVKAYLGSSLVYSTGLPAIAPQTIRFRFIEPRVDTEGLPAQITLSYLQGLQSYYGGYGTWTQVDTDIFDWHYGASSWAGNSQVNTPLGRDTTYIGSTGQKRSLLAYYKFDILDADLTGVTNTMFLFAQCSIVHCYSFRNTDDVENVYAMFNGRSKAVENTMVSMCDLSFPSVVGTYYSGVNSANNGAKLFLSNQTSLVSIGNIDLRNCVNCHDTFYKNTALERIGNIDLRSAGYVNKVFKEAASTAPTHLVSIGNLNISSAISAANMFTACSSLASIGTITSSSSLSGTNGMFANCVSITSAPVPTVMSGVTDMSYMYQGCSSLETVPLVDTYAAKDTSYMFEGCTEVASGALALYTQASTQATPPSTYNDMFTNCGSNTTTGAAELAQIPSSWGGTGA